MERIATVFCEFELSCANNLIHLPIGHKCLNLHGHNYKVRLEFKGIVQDNGFVIDYADVKTIWMKEIHAILDHQYLNNIIVNSTCENIAYWIKEHLNMDLLHKIEIYETSQFGVVIKIRK